jgi:tetratricopeptide (TPR) repeat protein
VVFCLLGMGTKEIMVSAPLMVFLYDRAFVSGSWRRAWQSHRGWYLALAATYLLLGWLVVQTGNRGGTAGINVQVTWWKYALTELVSVSNYLKLCFWPHPLVFDYGTEWFRSPFVLVPAGILIGGLLCVTVVALRKNSAVAVPAVLFFAILAPTSSVLPGIRQTSAEHRMYLPLAAVIVVAVAGWHRLLAGRSAHSLFGYATVAVAGGALAALTIQRNEVYRSEYTLYADTVAKRPKNYFAQYNLGKNLAESGRAAESLHYYRAAINLRRDLAYLRYNFANALVEAGLVREAAGEYRIAVMLDPGYVKAWYNLGNTLIRLGDKAGAVEPLGRAVELRPDHIEALDNLGSVLFELGRLDEARVRYEAAIRINPRVPEAHVNLGNLLAMQGEKAAARGHFEAALRLAPGFGPAREGLERLGTGAR